MLGKQPRTGGYRPVVPARQTPRSQERHAHMIPIPLYARSVHDVPVRIAIVADWLPTFAGAEHVVAEFCRLWPDAPVFTTVARRGHLGPLDEHRIITSSLQRWYRLLRNHKILLPWMPAAMENLDLRGFDVVISSSHAVGKGVIPPANAVHICYCHTPMRYAWEMEDQYLHDFRIPGFLRRPVRRRLKDLRRWDLTTAKRVDMFLANSSATQERIARVYGRESTVVHPPVEDCFLASPLVGRGERQGYYFAIGRLVPYKRFDFLIRAANTLGFRLKLAGTGQDASRLRGMAGPTVELLGYVPTADLPGLYAGAQALLFPQVEDAGVVPLEAQACGTPVVALGQGGIVDTVEEGGTGTFFAEQTVDSLSGALNRLQGIAWDPAKIRAHAGRFSGERFRRAVLGRVAEAMEQFQRKNEGVR